MILKFNDYIYYVTVSMSQEFKSGFVEWFHFKISYEVTVNILARVAIT